MSKEGSTEAPIRHPIDFEHPDFLNPEKLDAEMRRVFDICHGCRRCFNLCDSFPKLFDMIDESKDEDVESLQSEIENKNKAIAEKEVLVQESAKRARIAADTAERKQIMQEMMQPLSKDHKEIMGALLESVKTDKLQNAFNKYLPSVLKEDAKKPQKKVLSESVTEVTGDKAKASASADKQTADIVYLQKLAGIS